MIATLLFVVTVMGPEHDSVPLIDPIDFGALTSKSSSNSLTVIPTQGPTFKRALHLDLGSAATQPIGLHAKTVRLLHLGDTVYLRVWLRGASSDPHVPMRASVAFERTTEPYGKLIHQSVELTPEWKEYRFAEIAPDQFLPGDGQVSLSSDSDKGAIDVADLRCEDIGDVTPNMLKLTTEASGEEKRTKASHRAPVQISVLDASGKPIPGAQVSIEQASTEAASSATDDEKKSHHKRQAKLILKADKDGRITTKIVPGHYRIRLKDKPTTAQDLEVTIAGPNVVSIKL